MIKKKIFIAVTFIVLLCSFKSQAQVSIVSLQFLPFNVTPESMLSCSIMNNGAEQEVSITSRLYNFNNELLFSVRSSSFLLKQGLNAGFDGNRKVSASEYSNTEQANYIKTTHGLSNGTFKICVEITLTKTAEHADDFCDVIESEFNQYLYLVFPADKDTIETKSPILIWTHSEPFSVLSQGEFYRMIVSEINSDQTAEEAITINSPLLVKNYLTTHDLQYPYDAKELQDGKRYAWQVQKLANGVITNKTEAWEFIIRKKIIEKELKYVALKQTVDANYYTSYTGKIYFKFNEEYNSVGNIEAYIISDLGKEFSVKIVRDEKNSNTTDLVKIKVIGDNRFILDLDKENLKPGFYTMQIKNEKKEVYYLKFYLPE